MPQAQRVADILGGRTAVGAPATVQGWIRTRRDSKAGLSFLQVHDGSCFDALQVVAPATLANYDGRGPAPDRRLRRHRHRHRRRLAGPGAGRRAPRRRRRGRRLGGRPGHLPDLAEAAHVRVPARGRPPARADEHLRRGGAGPALPRHGHPPLLRRARLLLDPHADHHRQRCRGRGRAVPRLDARPGQPPAHARGRGRLRAGLLRQAGLPHRLRPAQRRGVLPGAHQRLHLRADVPGRELEHQPAPLRVLDGRAGDRLRRPLGQRRPGRGPAQVQLPRDPGRARRRHGVLRRADRQGGGHPARGASSTSELRAHGVHGGDRGPGAVRPVLGVPGGSGASTCRPSTSGTCARSTRSGRWWSSTTRRRSRRSTCA